MAKKEEIIKGYNELLATTAVFSQKMHNIHWNMKGQTFMEAHKLTDDAYEGLNDFIDDIAEKIIMQGGKPFVTLSDYIKNSKIKEVTKSTFTVKEGLQLAHKDFETYCKLLSKIKNNEFTQPLLDEILLFADKQRWLIKSSI